jgi:hypothetical protein
VEVGEGQEGAAIAAQQAGGDTGETEESSGPAAGETVTTEKDEAGFVSMTSARKRKEIIRERESLSAIGAVAALGSIGGMVFSSGIILKIIGALTLLYILFCLVMAIYTLYLLYAVKGDADRKMLRLKNGLKWSWIAPAFWVVGMFISVVGASYSFETSNMLAQVGSSYGIGTYLGLLSYGFYITLACFIMNGVKAAEI